MSTPADPLFAEQQRIESRLARLRAGESAVINGVPCTVISLQTAVLLDRVHDGEPPHAA